MAEKFVLAFSKDSFKLLELKEKNILRTVSIADELCENINKFLPYKFVTNHGINIENEENEVDPISQAASSENLFRKTSRARTIEELHKRIENLRGKRVSYKEKLLKKGLKNRLKKKRKLEERKQLKNKSKKLERLESEKTHPEPDNEIQDSSIQEKSLPTENNIKFNKLILSQSDNTKKPKMDPKSLLAKLEKKKFKLKKLEMKGKKEKLTEIKSKEAWDTAIQKAEGIKVKDNVDLLKKSMMKIKNRKNKSKKKWEEREKNLEQKKEKAQVKRQENINKKRKERNKKRTKILVKKGRILPK